MNTKNQASVGTLWRSAYQLGAAFIFTTGTRYRQQPTDTLKTDSRLPLFELDDWSQFAQFAPSRCKWVAVEMCGRRLGVGTVPGGDDARRGTPRPPPRASNIRAGLPPLSGTDA